MNRPMPPPEPEELRKPELDSDPKGSESIYRELFASSPFGVLVHDADGKTLLFNSRLEQITGYAAGEIPDIPTWLRLIYPHAEYRKIALAEPRDEAAPGVPRVRESMITGRDGKTCLCRFTSVRQESGLRIVYIQPLKTRLPHSR